MANVGVFLGSGVASPLYSRAVERLGRNIAKLGHTLICGASGNGLMGTLIGSALGEGGEVFAILPAEVASMEIPHHGLESVRTVDTVSERKRLIRELSDIIFVFPGGIGTLDEFFEAFALKRMGMFNKPIGLLNLNNYYQFLLSQIDNVVHEGFAKPKHRNLVVYAEDPDRLLDSLLLELERSAEDENA